MQIGILSRNFYNFYSPLRREKTKVSWRSLMLTLQLVSHIVVVLLILYIFVIFTCLCINRSRQTDTYLLKVLLTFYITFYINFPDIIAQQRALHSIISYGGINGVVHIEPNFRPNVSLGVVSFPNIRNTYLVEIRQNRVLTDVPVRCLDQDLGQRLIIVLLCACCCFFIY